MAPVHTDGTRIYVGERFSVSFQRTLRVPEDGQTYPLPPSLGPFPVLASKELRRGAAGSAPFAFYVPMYQREALWFGFDGAEWKPNAVKVGVGGINVITGEPLQARIGPGPQDYVVCPEQPWLDGINVGTASVRQFVAMPLGQGYTIEGQIRGAESIGGIEILVYEPKAGRFPDNPPKPRDIPTRAMAGPAASMGLAAGGRIKQRIYPDPYDADTWQPDRAAAVRIGLVNSETFLALTGSEPPPSPVNVQSYISAGLPWLDLYDADRGDLPRSAALEGVRSIEEKDAAKRGGSYPQTTEVDTKRLPVHHLRPPGRAQRREDPPKR